MVEIGHNLSDKDLFSRIEECWDLSGLFPKPKFKLKCPICNAEDDDIISRVITINYKGDSPHKYRANVSFKCSRCSYTWVHGIVIPDEMAERHGLKGAQSKSYNWRQIREALLTKNR